MLSLPPNDFGSFRSSAGLAVPAAERFRPFPFFRRSCCPCRRTISAHFVLPQVLSSLLHVGLSPAGRGRRAGTPLRGYPSHVASLVGPFRSRGRGRPRRPPAPASPAPMPSVCCSSGSYVPPCAAPVPCVPKLGKHGALFRGFRSMRPIVRDAKHANSCKLADNDLHLRKEEKEMILALFMIVLAVLFFRG